jgi:phage gpG-like protein
VFAAIHEWGTGVDTGVRVDQRRFLAVTLHERRLVRVETFSERSDALKAVALEE